MYRAIVARQIRKVFVGLSGGEYVNPGATFMRIRWGRVVEIREYLDTQLAAENLRSAPVGA